MKQSKKSYDWSKAPQGGIDGRGEPSYRSEPKLFWGVTNFLILTVGVGFSSSLIAPLTYILLFSALFFFVVGIVIIPIVALMQARRYWKMIASILRGVNLYVLITYALLVAIYVLTRYDDALRGSLSFAASLFGIGYFIAMTTSAAVAMEKKPTPVVTDVNTELEDLVDLNPSIDERV